MKQWDRDEINGSGSGMTEEEVVDQNKKATVRTKGSLSQLPLFVYLA
ncbi:hypothetical protein ACMX2M_25090 [Paenibacillus polymyxa]